MAEKFLKNSTQNPDDLRIIQPYVLEQKLNNQKLSFKKK